MEQLTEPQIYQFIDHYESWSYSQDGYLSATYEFEDFWEAISFVNDLAELAESHQHHPTITVAFTKVTVSTCTHDADDAITEKDTKLIEAIEEIIE